MNTVENSGERGRSSAFRSAVSGKTVLRTYRTKLDIDDIQPNERQPRLGIKEDEELQRQIEANEGLFEPLLVEPHPDIAGKFRIIDGERAVDEFARFWLGRAVEQYRQVPVEVTDRTLTDEERLRVWIYIHRQREGMGRERKGNGRLSARRLQGRASAANILGITVRELDKLVEIFELSERFTALREPSAAITWARELTSLSKKHLTSTVIGAVIKKVNQKRVTNSKDLRKLRTILPDPVAREHFLSEEGDLKSATLRVAPAARKTKPVFAANSTPPLKP